MYILRIVKYPLAKAANKSILKLTLNLNENRCNVSHLLRCTVYTETEISSFDEKIFTGCNILHVEHVSCVIMNCGQQQWVIPSPISIAPKALLEENITRKLLSLSLDLFFKILLFNVAFFIFFLSLSFLLTFFWLVCYCSMWLCFSQGTS